MNRIKKSEKLQDDILKRVLPLFLTHSYESISITLIEKITQTTRGTLYKYFKNKEELFYKSITKFYNSPLNIFYALTSSSKDIEEYWVLKISQLKNAYEYLKDHGIHWNIVSFTFFLEIQVINKFPNFKQQIIENKNKNLRYWEDILYNYLDKNHEEKNIRELAIIYHSYFLQLCSNYPECNLSFPKINIAR